MLAVVFASCLGLLFLATYILSREPEYLGRTASEWAEILVFSQNYDWRTAKQSEKAFKEMGEPGVRLLISRLEKGDSEMFLELRHKVRTFFGYKGKFYNIKERKLLYMRALGNLGTNAVSATPILLRGLDDHDGEIRKAAASAISHTLGHDDLVVPKMIELLKLNDPALTLDAIATLRHYPGKKDEFILLLEPRIDSPDFKFVSASCFCIKKLSPDYFEQTTIPHLITNLSATNSVQVANSIRALELYHPGSRELVSKLFSLLEHPDGVVRADAIIPLAEWVNDGSTAPERRKEGLSACIKLLDDPVEDVRVTAASSLLNWGDDARMALSKLENLYRSAPSNARDVRSRYQHVVFRLDAERGFELQKHPTFP